MKIAYVVAEGLALEHGVSKKILNQILFWVSEGHEVKLFYYSNKPLNKIFENVNFEIIRYSHRIDFVLNSTRLKEVEYWGPDIIYFRNYLFSRSFNRLMKKLPVVLEINSDDVAESKVSLPRLERLFHLVTREINLRNASGIICVTYELEELFSKYTKVITTIPNGINSPFIGKSKKNKMNRFQVVFLGSAKQQWHGIDKVNDIAKALPSIDFHIIGTREITDAAPNLCQYGYLSEEEYKSILETCDVGIGTLALHRKNMNEACPLKTREYLKYGLPIVIGYKDSDFIGKEKSFILEIPNKENNVESNVPRILEFIENSRNISYTKDDVIHIFSDFKERRRLEFLKKVFKNWGN
jgi:Glycosyltransferase Family 4